MKKVKLLRNLGAEWRDHFPKGLKMENEVVSVEPKLADKLVGAGLAEFVDPSSATAPTTASAEASEDGGAGRRRRSESGGS